MDFEKQKSQVLSRIDRSKKGSLDKPILSLVNLINSLPDYYTTSSCSGRILLIEVSPTRRKDKAKWLFLSHRKVKTDQITRSLSKISLKPVWLKQEPMIIHICCRDFIAAERMLLVCHEAGLKRAGIIAVRNKIIIEAFGNDRIDTIVASNGKVIVDGNYIRALVGEANKKHFQNLLKIKKLYEKIKNKS